MPDSRNDVTPQTLEIKTRGGTTYTLHEPSMIDIVEGERLLKEQYQKDMPFLSWFAAEEGISFGVFGMAMWLAARKHKLTEQQIVDKTWPFTLDQFLASLTIQDAYANMKAVAEFFTPAPGVLAALGVTSTEPSDSASVPG